MLVHKAMADGLPATDLPARHRRRRLATGETQKFDGPYFLAAFLRRQPPVALVPAVGPVDEVRVCLVPRDFVVDAMDELSVLDASLGRTYALTDPSPPTAREVVGTFAARLGKRVVWVPLPLRPTRTLVGSVPLMERRWGSPRSRWTTSRRRRRTPRPTRSTDLAGTDVRCPPFTSYADRLLDFMLEHPEVDDRRR